mgnify:CR=1 FL=1
MLLSSLYFSNKALINIKGPKIETLFTNYLVSKSLLLLKEVNLIVGILFSSNISSSIIPRMSNVVSSVFISLVGLLLTMSSFSTPYIETWRELLLLTYGGG